MIAGQLVPFVVLIPLVVAYIILLLGSRRWNFARNSALITNIVICMLNIVIAYEVGVNEPLVYHFGSWSPPWGIEFVIDEIAAFFLLVVSFVSLLILIFGHHVICHEIKDSIIGQYYAMFLILLASLNGITCSNDFFNIYVFLEVSSVAAAALVAINGHKLALEASIKYLILSTIGSGTVLLAIANIYMTTGHLNLAYIAEVLPIAYQSYPLNILASIGLLMVGLTIKAALYPLHVWLPDAHGSAPTTSSAILSGLVVKVYIIVFLKLLFNVFNLEFVAAVPLRFTLMIMSSLAIFIGSIVAIRQQDIKKMLAYSTVAQVGYIFLGIGLFTFYGLMGAFLHIINHAVMKAMLFLSAGLLIRLTNRRTITSLKGIGRIYPIPMVAFAIGAMSMVGLPPLSGFASKWYLGLGALEAGRPVYVVVILISSLLNAIYYFPVVIYGFFGQQPEKYSRDVAVSIGENFSLIVLSIATILLGLLSAFPIEYLTPIIKVWFE